ncbi:MAG: hypothetical protein HOO67_01140 [Candidatus Peribacteraceae bacterium]|nr:hypothetical protein [Candidatus Peribacteraceae bacterium]
MQKIRPLLLSILLTFPALAGAQSYVNLAGDTMLGALNITLNGGESAQTLLSLLGPMEVASNKPMIILKNTLTNRQWQLRNGANSFSTSFDIFDATAGKSRFVLDSNGNASIGTGVTALNSRLFVYGGPTGANIDVRGDPQTDQAIIELEGNNYDVIPNSVSLRYFGSKHNFGTTLMGIPVQKMGVLEWINASTALIYTPDNIPIIFGTNNKERMRISENGGLAIGTTNAGSAKLAVSGSVVFSALKNCDTIDTDTNGNLVCGSDASGPGGGSAFGTGNVIAIGDNRYVNIAGDTVNGALVLNGTVTLNSLKSCDTLDTDSNGNLQCGTDAVGGGTAFGTGNVIAIGDNRYINVSGDTMTGPLSVNGATTFQGAATFGNTLRLNGVTYTFPSSDGTAGHVLKTDSAGHLTWSADNIGTASTYTAGQGLVLNGSAFKLGSSFSGTTLKIYGTASGDVLHAERRLEASGILSVKGAVTLQSLKNCDTLDTDVNGNLLCGTDAVGGGTAFGTGNVITIGDNRYVNVTGDGMTGMLTLSSPSNTELLRFTNTTNSLTSGVYVGAADPNGTVQANKGSLFIDQSNGLAYVKTSANGANTGWSKISFFTDAILPTRATLWHDESTVVTGGGVSTNQDANQLYSTYSFQSPASANDAFVNGFTLKAGTYAFSVLGLTNNAKAKIDWSIDGVPAVSGQDWYSVTGTYNVVKTATVTVTGDGYHVLKGKVNGKNPSSTAYNLLFTKMWFAPIAQ